MPLMVAAPASQTDEDAPMIANTAPLQLTSTATPDGPANSVASAESTAAASAHSASDSAAKTSRMFSTSTDVHTTGPFVGSRRLAASEPSPQRAFFSAKYAFSNLVPPKQLPSSVLSKVKKSPPNTLTHSTWPSNRVVVGVVVGVVVTVVVVVVNEVVVVVPDVVVEVAVEVVVVIDVVVDDAVVVVDVALVVVDVSLVVVVETVVVVVETVVVVEEVREVVVEVAEVVVDDTVVVVVLVLVAVVVVVVVVVAVVVVDDTEVVVVVEHKSNSGKCKNLFASPPVITCSWSVALLVYSLVGCLRSRTRSC